MFVCVVEFDMTATVCVIELDMTGKGMGRRTAFGRHYAFGLWPRGIRFLQYVHSALHPHMSANVRRVMAPLRRTF